MMAQGLSGRRPKAHSGPMTITATCHPLQTPDPPGWRWQPKVYSTVNQPTLPIAAEPAGPRIESGVPAEVIRRFAHLTVEAIQGRRNPALLQPFFSAAALHALMARLPVLRPLGVHLASIRAQSPRPGVAEVTLRLAGDRDVAVAMRLAGQGRDWRCTALMIG